MFVSLWSAKGGSGTTVVAASLALLLARRHPVGAVAVDLAGDLPAVLGLAGSPALGVADWLAAADQPPPDGLARLEVAAADGLAVIGRGRGALAPVVRAELLAAVLGREPRAVVVDCGTVAPAGDGGPGADAVRTLAAAGTESLLVTRACYLALRRAADVGLRPSGVVLVREPGRALEPADVEAVLEAPVWAEVPVEPAIARAVDAGLLATRLPRSLAHALAPAR